MQIQEWYEKCSGWCGQRVRELTDRLQPRLRETTADQRGSPVTLNNLPNERGDGEESEDDRAQIIENVEQARSRYQSAKAYFETVSDPELVDHASHLMLAAEKRYVYLLKKARDRGIRGSLRCSLGHHPTAGE